MKEKDPSGGFGEGIGCATMLIALAIFFSFPQILNLFRLFIERCK